MIVSSKIQKFEMKSQMILHVGKSYTQAVPSALRLRVESFCFSDFFKSGRPFYVM